MTRQDKVISLELARKIAEKHKELGIEVPESEWVYYKNELITFEDMVSRSFWEFKDGDIYYPTYDTSELGEILPDYCCSVKIDTMWIDWKPNSGLDFCCYNEEKGLTRHKTYGGTEAECRGKMYLWLLQEGEIT